MEKYKTKIQKYLSDIQNCFEYIIKKHETIADNPLIKIYVNKIENRITFRIKIWYYLEHLMSETMKLPGITESKITDVVLIHFNIVSNDYKQDSRVLYTCVPNKSFGQSLDISPKTFMFLKTFDSEFSYI